MTWNAAAGPGWAQRACSLSVANEFADGLAQPCDRGVDGLVVVCAERVVQAATRSAKLHERLGEPGEPLPGVGVLQCPGSFRGHLGDGLEQYRCQQLVEVGDLPVERAEADPGASGDLPGSDPEPVLIERGASRSDQPVGVAARVDPAPRARASEQVFHR